jgi:hypothetical protein
LARYHFHIEDGVCFSDQDGSELPDLKTASATAIKVLAEHLQHQPADLWKDDCLQVHVTDDTGLKLLTLTVTAMFAPALLGREDTARP